jgi:signal transduction histidine kinase
MRMGREPQTEADLSHQRHLRLSDDVTAVPMADNCPMERATEEYTCASVSVAERMRATSAGDLAIPSRATRRTVTDLALEVKALRAAVREERSDRQRAECLAKIQSNAVQLALDLLVREPDIEGFFKVFTRTLVEETESHACGVWLLDEDGQACDLWMAYVGDRMYTAGSPDWPRLALPRESMAAHLFTHAPGWTDTIEYAGDDPRLPDSVRAFNRRESVHAVAVAPLVLGTRTLGWFALSSGRTQLCESPWRIALLEASARQATLALYQSRLAEQHLLEERRKAVLEERNRLARDIHDSLAQGFAAILMQLQAAQREDATLPPRVASSLDTAVELARTHMIEARRSVHALRPHVGEGQSLVEALRRVVDMVSRTTDVPVELVADDLPVVDAGVTREIVSIATEALHNAARHARARHIVVTASSLPSRGFHLSVADDGRGIPRERARAGFGLTSMQERAEHIGASLTIVTAVRRGTEVVLAWEPAAAVPARELVNAAG